METIEQLQLELANIQNEKNNVIRLQSYDAAVKLRKREEEIIRKIEIIKKQSS